MIFENLREKINLLPLDCFRYYSESERYGLLLILEYLYYYGDYERQMSKIIMEDSSKKGHISGYFDPILQFHDIQENNLEDAYILNDYNNNVVSELIWKCYLDYFI